MNTQKPILKKFNSILYALFALIFIIIACEINKAKLQKPQIVISREKHSINFTNSLKYVSAGLNRFLSAIFWIQTLMESDIERNGRIKNTWMYFRFLTISELDPLFLENYQYGGPYLSIIKDDLTGAEIIFLKGLKNYPNDYILNYNLAFLYFNEFNQPEKSLPYLLKVKDSPLAPKFIAALIGTIMEKNAVPISDIIEFIEQARKANTNPLYDDLYEIKLKKLRAIKK